MNHNQTYDIIKKDFCHLFQFKSHGDTLELITPLVTLTDKFVSVFVTQRGDKLIVTDGGWIYQNIYDNPLELDEREIISILLDQYTSYYHVKKNSNHMYFRSVTKIELLSAAVFDIANFIVGVVNSYSVSYRDKKDKEDRDKFRSETNDFFKKYYKEDFKSNSEILNGIRYSGVLTINNRLNLFEYVTGSTSRYFEQDLRKSIVDFQLIEGTYIRQIVDNKIAIFNDHSIGFKNGGCSPILVSHLEKYTTRENLLRSNIEEVFSIISPN